MDTSWIEFPFVVFQDMMKNQNLKLINILPFVQDERSQVLTTTGLVIAVSIVPFISFIFSNL